MLAAFWGSFFESPAFGAVVALAGVLLADWLRGRRDRTREKSSLVEAHRERQRGLVIQLQDALTEFMSAESKYTAMWIANRSPGFDIDLMHVTMRTTSLISRIEDGKLQDLAQILKDRIADQLESKTAQELTGTGTEAMVAFYEFSERVSELLSGELREGGEP